MIKIICVTHAESVINLALSVIFMDRAPGTGCRKNAELTHQRCSSDVKISNLDAHSARVNLKLSPPSLDA